MPRTRLSSPGPRSATLSPAATPRRSGRSWPAAAPGSRSRLPLELDRAPASRVAGAAKEIAVPSGPLDNVAAAQRADLADRATLLLAPVPPGPPPPPPAQ